MRPTAAAEPFPGFDAADVPRGVAFSRGKVRDIFHCGDTLLIVTSDRISAFDRILGLVPHKGEVLTQLSSWWFDRVGDIVAHHLLATPTARSMHVQRCDVLPVEVVVRAYLTGSAWRDYQAGRPVSGITLPGGMRWNEQLRRPLLTPSTKAGQGAHDRPISCAEVVELGLVAPRLWQQIEETALALFERGRRICAERGLILVDTKYEFGLCDGRLTLADEIHTPDSSRFWFAGHYRELFERGQGQRKLDKEYLRQWLMDHGFLGDGEPPAIPAEVFDQVAQRYISAYETITSKQFAASGDNVEAARQKVLLYLSGLQSESNEEGNVGSDQPPRRQ
ncbi:MAG: phosphoribosylaminoimidazolesuccinocarboxamide synthase [Spirochaetaceae bacterium]|nr:MAG: phosphoribosylaminoimidazolesuccinocarboxamide synthase [Spirochaetaceae bacterium]